MRHLTTFLLCTVTFFQFAPLSAQDLPAPPFTEDFEGEEPLSGWLDGPEPSSTETEFSVVEDPTDGDNKVLRRSGMRFTQTHFPFEPIPDNADTVRFSFRYYTDSVNTGWADAIIFGTAPDRVRFQNANEDGAVRFDDGAGNTAFVTDFTSGTWHDIGVTLPVGSGTAFWTIDGDTTEVSIAGTMQGVNRITFTGNELNTYYVDDLAVSFTLGDPVVPQLLTAPFTETFSGDDPLALWRDGTGSIAGEYAVVADPTDENNPVLRRDGGQFTTSFFPFDSIPAEADTVVVSFRYYTESVDAGWADVIGLGAAPDRIRLQSTNDSGVFRVDDANNNNVFLPGFAAETWYDVSAAIAIADSLVTWTLRDTSFTVKAVADFSQVSQLFFTGNETNVFYVDDVGIRTAQTVVAPDLRTAPFTEDFSGENPLAGWEDANGSVANDVSIVEDPTDATNLVLKRDGTAFNNVFFPFDTLDADLDTITWSFRYYTESVTDGWADFIGFGKFPERIRIQAHADDGVYRVDDANGTEVFIDGFEAGTWYDIYAVITPADSMVTWSFRDTTFATKVIADLSRASNIFIGGNASNVFYVDDISVLPGNQLPTSTNEAELVRLRVTAFPNPTAGSVTIALESNELKRPRVEVFSMMGRRVFSGILTGDRTQIDLSGLPRGMYVYRILDGQRPLVAGRVARE